ncbi:DNA internalization-related competence protein ComEC/Rec2 [Pelistega sp. MC2]|uniref:DNA internalization-related competence protein ComEC/Rec2 n=1 Tax=Pelistega sp. MC2 TaxID=1720297 RepID=UPI000ADF2E7D|nr:DNA internalization-related competence protein ComEC/Rec2 [Pelistega sp. MC2]
MLSLFLAGMILGFFAVQRLTSLPTTMTLLFGLLSLAVISYGLYFDTINKYFLEKNPLIPKIREVREYCCTHQGLATRFPLLNSFFSFLLGVSVAVCYVLLLAYPRLYNQLSDNYDNKVTTLDLCVVSLATYRDDSIEFDAELLSPIKGIPSTIRVLWNLSSTFDLYQSKKVATKPTLRPGDCWRMSLRLRKPNTLMNTGVFDNETYLFQENIRALGTVKQTPEKLAIQQLGFNTYIQAVRDRVRERMQAYLQGKRYAGVIQALVIGDQQSIAQADWQLFNRTGMTHLVSISGSHITMVSSLAVAVSLVCFKRIRYKRKLLADYVALKSFALGIGVIVALLYCLLAGWGIPAQRTFLMLLIFYIVELSKRKFSSIFLLLLAAVIVLLLDPWAILTTGFYLSFGAVVILSIMVNKLKQTPHKNNSRIRNVCFFIKEWLLLQGIITIGMMPFLIQFFHQVSLISPIVNSYAILVVGYLITPLALLLGIFSVLNPWQTLNQWVADTCHQLLEWVMQLSSYLSEFTWAVIDVGELPEWINVLSGIALLIYLMPKGIPYARLAPIYFMPSFLYAPPMLQEGEWQIHALDIGQGGAVLIQTQHHTLLFDTGLRSSPHYESGTRVLIPFLRAQHIHSLDAVVISHADLDHSGGLSSLVETIHLEKMFASFQVNRFIDEEERRLGKIISSKNPQLMYQQCKEGVEFEWDQVRFHFLNKAEQATIPIKSKNYQSCILSIEGKYDRALLTGDMLQEQERMRNWQHYTLVQVPHHGSKSSSSEHFIQQIAAKYAFAQTGFYNSYRHPHPVIEKRWQDYGSQFFNTALTGEIVFASTHLGFHISQWRHQQRRYWHR